MLVVFIGGCGSSTYSEPATDTITPVSPTTAVIVTTVPPIGATNVNLNGNITVLFDHPLDPATVNTSTVILTQGGTVIPGSVDYANNTIIFDPTNNLDPSTEYILTITTGVTDAGGNPLMTDYVSDFTTGTTLDTTPPIVILTSSLDGAIDVPYNRIVSAVFSEALDPMSANTTTFTLTQGGVLVAGTISYESDTIIFHPTSELSPLLLYTATLTTGIHDLAGNAIASNYVWSFTTGATPDTTPPTVISVDPLNGATNVPYNRSVTAIISEALKPLTVTSATFTLTKGGNLVAGIASYDGDTITFNPTVDMSPSTLYTATITTGIKDLAGNAMAINYVWSFTTGATKDTTPPTVVSVDPLNGAINVPLNRSVSAIMNEALNPVTISSSTFTLSQAGNPVIGVVSYDGNTTIFNPTADLNPSTLYTATLTKDIKDLAGNAMVSDYVWSFTTGVAKAVALVPINLGTSGNYAILTKTGITTTGVTAITGHIGVSPIARAAMTGFSDTLSVDGTYSTSIYVTGRLYAADLAVPTPSILTTAIGDMQTAYAEAAGRALPTFIELGAGDVSGMTLTPGLYKWGTGLLITNGGITISGGATDVWIFQISGDLTLQSGAIITLAGGALAKNIFWQVEGGTGVTLGTGAEFKGILLAQKAITLSTGVKVNGRLLSQTAVTLDANTITQP